MAGFIMHFLNTKLDLEALKTLTTFRKVCDNNRAEYLDQLLELMQPYDKLLFIF